MPHRDSARSKTKKLPPLKGKSYEVRGRIWIDGKDGTFLGHGRVALMEKIKELGSITKAAKEMDMSYRHAWRLIDSMNKQSPNPFVITAAGGKNGGGTIVTEHGQSAIKLFWKLHKEFQEFLTNKTDAISLEEES